MEEGHFLCVCVCVCVCLIRLAASGLSCSMRGSLLHHCYCYCYCEVTSVVSDSVWPHRQQATRLPRPWDSPGKNTGVGCHFLLQCVKVKSESEVAQSGPTLSNPMDCSPPGSSVNGIFQARVLEWGAIAFSNAWKWKVKVKSLSHVRPPATPWTAAYQASPSMGFSRQEYWSGVPLPLQDHYFSLQTLELWHMGSAVAAHRLRCSLAHGILVP